MTDTEVSAGEATNGGSATAARDVSKESGGPLETMSGDLPSEGFNGTTIPEREAEPTPPLVKTETGNDAKEESLPPSIPAAPPIQSIVVSPKPFAAGVNASVFHCEVVFTSASNDEKPPAPTSSTSSAPLAYHTPTILKINRPQEEEEPEYQLSASLLLADSHWWCPIESLNEIVDQEIAIYKALQPLQGKYVPRFFGTLEPSVVPKSHCSKLVLENGGVALSAFAVDKPKLYRLWNEEIEDRAMEAIDACHGLKVTHHGLRMENVLVHWSVKAPEADEATRQEKEQGEEWWDPFAAKTPAGSNDPQGGQSEDKVASDSINRKIYSLEEIEKRCEMDGQLQIPPDLRLHVYLVDWKKGKTGKTLWRARDEVDKLGERLIKLLASVDKKIKADAKVDTGPGELPTSVTATSPDAAPETTVAAEVQTRAEETQVSA